MHKLFSFFVAVVAASALQAQTTDFAARVNPFIGTGGHGHTHPAAVVPHGMIQPGPDTRCNGWDACSGYHYSDRTLNGFTQTRLSGTGCADMADFLLMPVTGRPELGAPGDKSDPVPWAATFSHDDEQAEPGFYSVLLQPSGIRTDITSTERTALYRFSYPAGGEAGLLVDLYYHNQEQWVYHVDYEQTDDHTLRAFHRSQGWAYNQPLYFMSEFSAPFDMEVVKDTVQEGRNRFERTRLLLRFKPDAAGRAPREVMAKVALSYCDCRGAALNLRSEQAGWDFDGVRRRARQKWNDCLGKIDVRQAGEAAADSTLEIFYTALYHANISPTLFCDVDGRYLGMDIKVHRCDPVRSPMYTVFSLWDTFRALHPLVSIVEPERNEAYIRSLVQKGEEFGIVPKWELTGNETGCMIGYHYVSLLADMYTKGYRDYDVPLALRHAVRSARYDTAGISHTLPGWKMAEVMPEARYWKVEHGYIPCDKTGESVAKALEYAYDDWCIAQVAKGEGDAATAARFEEMGQAYRHYFDPQTRFMRGRTFDGGWRTPFDPTSSDHRMDDYTEGNAWQWSFFAPHDPEGLMGLYGGRKAFLAKLDSLFEAPSEMTGDNVSPDIAGFIGQYAHGNEPSHGTIFLYNYAGRPWRTQELVDSVLYTLYSTAPDGLSGNEDCGQMSAWYILSALGFYQMCPGEPVYTLARPLFGEAVVHLPGGKTFTVRTRNNSRQNKYIRSARLNGKKLRTPFFTHEQLARGGVLEIEMGPKPRK